MLITIFPLGIDHVYTSGVNKLALISSITQPYVDDEVQLISEMY